MVYYGSDSDQLGEEVLFNFQPTVSDATAQPQTPLLLQQQSGAPVQNNTSNNGVLVFAGVLVALYLYSRS